MKVTAKIEYPTDLILKVQQFQSGAAVILKAAMESIAIRLQNRIKDNLSGKVLNAKSGTLRRSIGWEMYDSSSKAITAKVFSRGIPYSAIHEFGGRTRPHIIEPRDPNGTLAFKNMAGKTIFTKMVKHPGSRIPERSYMRSALKEMEPEIKRELVKSLLMGLKNGK